MSRIQDDNVKFKLDLEASEAQEKIHALTKATDALRKQSTEYRKEISRLAATEGDHSEEIKRLNEAIKANSREIEENKRAMEVEEKKIDKTRMTAAQLGKTLKDLKRQLSNTSKALDPKRYRELEDEIRKTEKAYAKATKSSRGFLVSLLSLDKIGTTIKGFFMGLGMVITTQVLGAFKKLTDTIMDFERANSKLAAVLGTSLEGVSRLTEQAKFLGRTTTATASQVTQLQTELAKLGFTQDVIEKITPSVLKFSKAVDTDLSSAAAFAGAAMRMFNKDADEAESVLATFAVATTKSALDFNKLQASLSTVGPVAHAFGFTIEDTVALLGQLSNAGFDASTAATATRNILLNLADSSGDLAQALGGPVNDLDGLVAGLQKLDSEGVDLAKALELTDKRSVAAFSTFLNGADNIKELRDSITNCNADFKAMSATMADNAAGSAAGFQSALEGLVLKFFDFREAIKTMFEWATVLVNWVGSIVDAFKPLGVVISFTAKCIDAVISGMGTLVGWLSKLITQTYIGRTVLNAVVVALIAYKVHTLGAISAVKGFIVSLALKAKALFQDAAANLKAAIATRSFNAALMANPILLIVGLLTMVIAATVEYCMTMDDASESTSAWTEASKEASRQYGEQKGKIEALIMVAENENLSLKRRQKAIAELNKIIPGYNAKIDATTGKYTASKKALDAYLVSLEKEMRYKASESKMQELVSAAEEARDAYDEAEIAVKKKGHYENHWYGRTRSDESLAAQKLKKEWKESEQRLRDFKARMTNAINEGVITPPAIAETDDTPEAGLERTGKAASETVTRLKEVNEELKKLRKMDPQSDEELDRIQKRIKLLQQEKKELLGKNSAKHEAGTYREDSLDEVSAPIDDAHQRRLLQINKQDLSETEKSIAKNRELIRYCDELTQALEKLRAGTNASHTKTLDAITKEQNKLAEQSAKAQQEINKALIKQDSEDNADRLKAVDGFYQHQTELIRAAVIADNNIEEAAKVYQLELDRKQHNNRLKALQDYYDKVAAADYYGAEEKKKTLKKIGEDISKAQSQILTDTGKMSEMMRESLTNASSIEGVKLSFDNQRSAVEMFYEALKEAAAEDADMVAALEAEKRRRVSALNYQYLEEQYKMQEAAGLSWADEYDRELAKLKNMHEQGLISESDFQKARLALQVKNVNKYFDYYQGLADSMVSAIQDAEIARSEAKYDVLIQQARNNGEDTAALEQEKENKKLEIQKKYADVDFAVKISQIIANTAVAIMQAFAQLGPIGGAVAAAMLSATGVAQMAIAKAERDKIKNMQPGNVGGAAKEAIQAERVLSGYAEGGYTGPGARYEVAGVVHRGEYVVPMPIMNNPRVVDAVGTIEAIRRNKGLANGMSPAARGYADGGHVAATAPAAADTAAIADAVADLRAATEALRNVRAYVVYKDIETAGQNLAAARAPFTRK